MLSKPTGAYVYADELVNSVMAKAGLPIHYYVYVLPLIEEAIRELSKHSVDCLHHVLLPRYVSDAGKTGVAMNLFALPADFSDWMTIGVRNGDHWKPIAVNNRLLPFLQPSSDVTVPLATVNGGTVTNWNANPNAGALTGYGWMWQYFAPVNVTVSTESGAIIVPSDFPYDELYVVYTGVGSIVPGTHIPRTAQEMVESYAFWKLAFNKSQYQIARERLAVHQASIKRFRRSQVNLNATVIEQLMYENYGGVKM